MKKTFALVLALLLCATPAWSQSTKSQLSTEIGTNFPDNTAGLITPSILRSTVTDFVNSWQQAPRVNAQIGTTYTFVVDDYGKMVTFSNVSAIAVSLPQAAGGFTTWNVTACNLNTGLVTITPTTSTIGGAGSLVLNQNECREIVSDGTNYQLAAGANNARIAQQAFTASGTYTPTAKMQFALVIAVGGGGGGGGVPSPNASTGSGGGGGGSGATTLRLLSAAQVGASQTVTIGAGGNGGAAGSNNGSAGGTTSVGVLVTAPGGSGGTGGLVSGGTNLGGAGGVAGTGDVAGTGAPGQTAVGTSNAATMGGTGGSSWLGGGGIPSNQFSAAGNNAQLFGGGGSGAVSFSSGGAFAGGNGAAGVIWIIEFIRG